tara:strand:+ start:1101 stop:1619 length:519 start_codon:yes stop_codon:yes gene_type:complete
MAGSLVLIQETTVSTSTATVSLVGIDSTFDVYKVVYNNLTTDTDNKQVRLRFTVSGTADSSSNYDYAYKDIRSANTFADVSDTDSSEFRHNAIGTGTSETSNGVLHLFNFSNSSINSFYTLEETMVSLVPEARGRQGAGMLTVNQATDGVVFLLQDSANFTAGTFKLYGLKK